MSLLIGGFSKVPNGIWDRLVEKNTLTEAEAAADMVILGDRVRAGVLVVFPSCRLLSYRWGVSKSTAARWLFAGNPMGQKRDKVGTNVGRDLGSPGGSAEAGGTNVGQTWDKNGNTRVVTETETETDTSRKNGLRAEPIPFRLWSEHLASCSGKPVRRSGIKETSKPGAALLAAFRDGVVDAASFALTLRWARDSPEAAFRREGNYHRKLTTVVRKLSEWPTLAEAWDAAAVAAAAPVADGVAVGLLWPDDPPADPGVAAGGEE